MIIEPVLPEEPTSNDVEEDSSPSDGGPAGPSGSQPAVASPSNEKEKPNGAEAAVEAAAAPAPAHAAHVVPMTYPPTAASSAYFSQHGTTTGCTHFFSCSGSIQYT